MSPRTSYEITLLPPDSGGPWRASVTIARGFGPGNSWTGAPFTLKATTRNEARREAKIAVADLVKTLSGKVD